jgi:hypothetical protein
MTVDTFCARLRRKGECIEFRPKRGKGNASHFVVWWGKERLAPRQVAWMLNGGALHAGMVIIRSCGNVLCVRPEHLRQVPRTEAARLSARLSPRRWTAAQVAEVRRIPFSEYGAIAELARRWGVPRHDLYNLRTPQSRRRIWREVQR